MPEIKIGRIYLEDGDQVDAVWQFDEGSTIDLMADGFLVARFDPSEIKALYGAILNMDIERVILMQYDNCCKKHKK